LQIFTPAGFATARSADAIIHENGGNPIWKNVLILLKLHNIWHFYKINLSAGLAEIHFYPEV
jgi:hypothetical protein